jgi:hypothetical protein
LGSFHLNGKEEGRMFRDAKVGDRVWDITSGWGKINNIISWPTEYPVVVVFGEDEFPYSYTYQGRMTTSDINPSLFWDEVKIIPPPKPKQKVKKTLWLNIFNIECGSYTIFGYGTEQTADGYGNRNRLGNKAHKVEIEYNE